MEKIYLIDVSGYLYRSYHAIRQMTNGKGESTNALFGFVRALTKVIKDFSPTHMAAVFDGPLSIKQRTAIYPEYKAHRKKMPDDLSYQMVWARKFCELMGIPLLDIPEVEADDTMGSIAVWAAREGARVYLCSTDKDLCQLVDDHVFIINTFKDNQILHKQEVLEQFSVHPSQIVDFLAMTGDASDNIPGLTGIGPKTAADLLKEFGTLDFILDHPELVPGKKKQETIRLEKDKVLLSRRLVTIDTSVPFTKDFSFFSLKEPHTERLRAFYTEMNFSSLLRELEGKEENSLSKKEEKEVSYLTVDEEKDLRDLVALLSEQKNLCIDTETTDIHPMKAELVGIGLGFESGRAWYVPMNGKLGSKTALAILRPLFENQKIGFYGHNIKYDLHVLRNAGIPIASIAFDTILASYLLNSHSRQHSLDHLSLSLFGKVKIDIQELVGKGKQEISMRDVPIEKVSYYCCEDVDYTIRLYEIFTPQIHERGFDSLFYNIELPLLSVLAEIEERGIFVSVPVLKSLSEEFNREISIVSKEIYAMAGEEFSLNSPKQLSKILFEKLGIRPPKKTATGYSTNAEVLEGLQHIYPIAGRLLEYRSLEKLRSTYIETLPCEVLAKTGRIHCTFNQSVAATGRLSCQDPNLQNIPVRTAMGRKIREAFRPEREGWSYLSADYSQIELRLLAHFSEDPELVRAFFSNEDIHTYTAAQIFSIPRGEVTPEQRSQAKAVNFGIMYGQQAFGLSQELGIEPKKAAAFIEVYFQRYHKVKEFLDRNKESARVNGKAVSLLGRERLIPEITSTNAFIRSAAERLAVNTPLQASQADLIKMAMLEVDHLLKEKKYKAFMILQIHDELLFEVPDEELEEVGTLVAKTMAGVISLKVPLVVDIHVGKNWKEC